MSATKSKVLVCPYCGDAQAATERCRSCGGLFEPLSRQATHNAMGPWFVRSEQRPFQPGASYETIVKLIERGLINRYSIIRGPTTRQYWTVARRVPGIAHLLGYCHNCDATVSQHDHGCASCGVPFGAYLDRNYLGLPDIKPLPWEAAGSDDSQSGAAAGSRDAGMPSREIDFRGAASPLGISSFASDEELRASPAPVGMSDSRAAVENGAAHFDNAGSDPASNRSTALDSAGSVAARSLQRRLDRQQSQIRVLMIVLAAVSILSVVVIIALLARTGSMQRAGESQQPDSPVDRELPSPQALTQPDAPEPELGPSPIVEETANMPSAATMPATAPAATQPSDMERAGLLLERAKDESRPLKDRIADAESAIAILEPQNMSEPKTTQSPEREKLLTDARRLLERLKLQEYFP